MCCRIRWIKRRRLTLLWLPCSVQRSPDTGYWLDELSTWNGLLISMNSWFIMVKYHQLINSHEPLIVMKQTWSLEEYISIFEGKVLQITQIQDKVVSNYSTAMEAARKSEHIAMLIPFASFIMQSTTTLSYAALPTYNKYTHGTTYQVHHLIHILSVVFATTQLRKLVTTGLKESTIVVVSALDRLKDALANIWVLKFY